MTPGVFRDRPNQRDDRVGLPRAQHRSWSLAQDHAQRKQPKPCATARRLCRQARSQRHALMAHRHAGR